MSTVFKQPRSIQVVIFRQLDSGRVFLLLKRTASYAGAWQTVTGSLEPGETHRQAAAREVWEETGIKAEEAALIDLDLVNTFEIAPEWRARYAPGVTHNREVCFALQTSADDVVLQQAEHQDFQWAGLEKALEKVYWESTRRALRRTEEIAVRFGL